MSVASGKPLHVLLTFDIEVWCGGWNDLDASFPAAFKRYFYGSSRHGDFALPRTLEILNAHGLKGVFFVEPLFAARFGVEPLAEVVELIRQAGQEVQMHLHPEWQNEAREPLIANHLEKRQGLIHYDMEEQVDLIGHGIRLLQEAGAERPNAFRSGGFNSNADTFVALERNGIRYDSSINITLARSGVGMPADLRRVGSHAIRSVRELPLSVFRNAAGKLRHVQVGSCAYSEMVQILNGARDAGWHYCNVLSHNFEMLLRDTSYPDWTVVRRFEQLCRYLSENRREFPTVDFSDAPELDEPENLPLPTTGAGANMTRFLEQGYRGVLERSAKLLFH